MYIAGRLRAAHYQPSEVAKKRPPIQRNSERWWIKPPHTSLRRHFSKLSYHLEVIFIILQFVYKSWKITRKVMSWRRVIHDSLDVMLHFDNTGFRHFHELIAHRNVRRKQVRYSEKHRTASYPAWHPQKLADVWRWNSNYLYHPPGMNFRWCLDTSRG